MSLLQSQLASKGNAQVNLLPSIINRMKSKGKVFEILPTRASILELKFAVGNPQKPHTCNFDTFHDLHFKVIEISVVHLKDKMFYSQTASPR